MKVQELPCAVESGVQVGAVPSVGLESAVQVIAEDKIYKQLLTSSKDSS